VEFEWDEAKSRRTFAERGFDFEFACGIFGGLAVEWPDDRRAYGERRVVAVGRVGEVFVTVVYTDRLNVRRIIAAWPSSRKERKLWQSAG
jgi:uncharacterized protein